VYLDDGSLLPPGQWKWHGGLRAGHKIYGFPNNADDVLVIDCQKESVYMIPGNEMIKSGRHRIPQDGRYKYLGGATNQIHAYLFPCDAERVLRIDCKTDEIQLIGPLLLDGENKFQNGFYCQQDGCIYGIPQRATGVLRIIPGGELQRRRVRRMSLLTNTPDDQYDTAAADVAGAATPDQASPNEFDRNDDNDNNQPSHSTTSSDPSNDDPDDDVVDVMDCGSDLIAVKDKFEGGVLGPDGCVYCIPLRSSFGIKIVPASDGK
jgi:hypothetical protein